MGHGFNRARDFECTSHMKDNRPKIFYTYLHRLSFVNTDLSLLEKDFQIITHHFRVDKKLLIPFRYLVQFIHLFIHAWRVDYLVCFFAGYHSLLPAVLAKVLGKKCFIFLGGTDCFKYPSFRYGNYTKPLYGYVTCLSAKSASLLIPVSENLILNHSHYYNVDSGLQGIYHWCKELKTPYQVIPLEYNPAKFYREDVIRNTGGFISVAFGIQGSSFVRKGIDKVIMLAGHFPENRFTIIGCSKENFPVPVPGNVNLIPPVHYDSLPDYYSSHQFYLQLSIAEGFPSAICEAMLCECIPIGSNVAAIPLIIGDHGFLVNERKDELIIDIVRKALAFSEKEKKGKAAREHIIANYGPGKRISALKALFAAER